MDKELLFQEAVDDGEPVELPGKGTVRVRGLTRAEMHKINGGGKAKQDPSVIERRTIQAGMVDPALSYEEVTRWANAAKAGELQLVIEKIIDLSGMGDGEDKEIYQQFREES